MAQRNQDELHVSNEQIAEADVDLLKAKNGETTIIGETVDDVTVLMVELYDRVNDRRGDDGREPEREEFSDGFVDLVLWAAGKGSAQADLGLRWAKSRQVARSQIS